jgi:hypothetical protein
VRRSFAALNAHDIKTFAETLGPNYKAMEIGLPKDNDRNAAPGVTQGAVLRFS